MREQSRQKSSTAMVLSILLQPEQALQGKPNNQRVQPYLSALDVCVGCKDAGLQPEDGPQQDVSQGAPRPEIECLANLVRHPVEPQHMRKVAPLRSTCLCASIPAASQGFRRSRVV